MDTTTDMIRARVSLPEAISQAKACFLSGETDPLEAWANLSRFKKMIEALQDDPQVRDYALGELSKYGKERQMPDCKMEQIETGVKYDYSECGDSQLQDMYATLSNLKADIKDREALLRCIPEGQTIADADTGEVLRRPHRTSKTTIKVTFKK